VRRRSVLLAAPAGLLALAGCGTSSGSSDKASTAADSGSSPSPTAVPKAKIVSGPLPAIIAGTKFGQKPTVAKDSGKPSADLAVRTVIPGSGAGAATGDFLRVNYLGQIWRTGKVFDNSYDRHQPVVFQVNTGQNIPGWDQGLVGSKQGSRVQLAIPPRYGYGSQGQPQAGIKGTDTLVFVVDVADLFTGESSAKGRTVPPGGAGLPRVGTNTDGKAPAIDVPKGAPPKKLESGYVIEGDGPAVGKSDALLVQYKGVLWDGGKEFDSTYAKRQLTQFSLDQVIKGWAQGLTGKKAGSRVVIVIPPNLGYGKQETQGIPGNSTLVFSVDILAVL
jgi:peptidylprolyl isomerase